MEKDIKKEELTREYKEWKFRSLDVGGYFVIFEGFKETELLSKISGNALKLYIYLGLYSNNSTGECWPSISRIAKYFKKSERTIYNWINELKELGLIERIQFDYNGKTYTFLRPYQHSSPKEVKNNEKRD